MIATSPGTTVGGIKWGATSVWALEGEDEFPSIEQESEAKPDEPKPDEPKPEPKVSVAPWARTAEGKRSR